MFYLLVSWVTDTSNIRSSDTVYLGRYLLYAVKRSMNFQLMTSHSKFIEKDSRYIANII